MNYGISLFWILIPLVAGSCASSQNNREIEKSDYPNLVDIEAPATDRYSDSRTYVDSVEYARLEEQPVLVVHGDFPDGCTHLREASHEAGSNRFELTLKAWRDPEQSCTQALVPFTFIYDRFETEELEGLDSLTINEHQFSIH